MGQYNKAISALLNTAAYFGAAFGLDLQFLTNPEVMSWLLPALNTLLVYFIPNTA